MPGLVPGIDVFSRRQKRNPWMAGTSPAMTNLRVVRLYPAFTTAAVWPNSTFFASSVIAAGGLGLTSLARA